MSVEVKRIREKNGMKAQDMAAVIGVTPSGLCLYEKGKRPIPCDVYAQMACALNNKEMLHEKMKSCPVWQAMNKIA